MGDRANIYLTNSRFGETDTDHGIYVYTHWSGSRFPEKLRVALDFAKGRWNDAQYLQRIIIDQALRDVRDSDTGGGVSLDIGDNEYPIIVVDVNRNMVAFADEGSETDPDSWTHAMTFTAYVAQAHARYPED